MKKRLLPFIIAAFMTLLVCPALVSQNPPQPPASPSGNGGNPPVGGGSPIGSGITILLTLGIAYGGHKFYLLKKDQEE